MKFYTIDEKEKNILLYEYRGLAGSIYEYKKRKMEEEKQKLLQATFTIKRECDYYFKDDEFNVTKSDNISGHISYYDVNSSLDEQQELLERFYRGEVVIGCMKEFYQPSIFDINDIALFPEEIRVKKSEYQWNNYTLYFTNDVIKVPKSIMLLMELEMGNINLIASKVDELDDQLKCFDFSEEPVDTIKLESLIAMYDRKRIAHAYSNGYRYEDILYYTIKTAKENQRVLKLVKSKNN